MCVFVIFVFKLFKHKSEESIATKYSIIARGIFLLKILL